MGTKGIASTARAALACSAAALVALSGCAAAPPAGGSKPPSPPAAPTLVAVAPPPGLGVVERFAWQTVTQMGEALGAGDAQGFLAKVSRAFYRGYSAVEQATSAFVEGTVERAVVVAVQEVRLEEERVIVRARWSVAVVSRDGDRRERAGETLFLFRKGDQSLRLFDYQGDPPFGLEGI